MPCGAKESILYDTASRHQRRERERTGLLRSLRGVRLARSKTGRRRRLPASRGGQILARDRPWLCL